MTDLRIVLMKEEHIDEVYDLLQESFSVPWSRESIREEIGCSRAVTLVALEEKEVIGYVNAHYLFDEGDLNLIAVKQAYRQKKWERLCSII